MLEFNTVPELLTEVHKNHKSKIAYKYKLNDKFVDITFGDIYLMVEKLALSFLDLGLKKGDRIGLISENRYEWIISSLAISCIGCVDVPVFPILTPEQESYIFNDCEATAIIVSNKYQLSKLLKVSEEISSLRQIIILEDLKEKDITVKAFTDLIQHGELLKEKNPNKFIEQAAKVSNDDLLTLIYTSGTTGAPKGVMLTHRNMMSNVEGARELDVVKNDDLALSFLPFCHAYERTTGFYTMFSYGVTVAIAESIDAVPKNINEVRPTVMTTVPKLLETIKKKVYNLMEREGGIKLKIFIWAMTVGSKNIKLNNEGKSSFINNRSYKFADKLVYSKIRLKLGGNLERFISGGAALSYEVAEFFAILGVNIYQGYGLTEASPCISCNSPSNNELGTIGHVMLNQEVKIAKDGEILVKGPNVMKGYWNNEEETNNTIDELGWLHTGDIGEFTEKGNLIITDRKKNIFVNKGGKNIAPQQIESALSQSQYVNQVVLIGDNREYNIALIHCNDDMLEELKLNIKLEISSDENLKNNTIILREIKKDLDAFQSKFAKYEQARKIILLDNPLTVESGELTPKQSIKRHIVIENYAHLIDELY